MRKKFIAGNWKMFLTKASAVALAKAIVEGRHAGPSVQIAVCPPFPYLGLVAEALPGSDIGLGAQNLYPERERAVTGEVSPTMLVGGGCQWVILGHSEHRHKLDENDAFINKK